MKLINHLLALSLVACLAGAACSNPVAKPPSTPPAAAGIHKIQHVVVIMQENRSIEDDGGQRLDPKTDGRADPRPTVRENAPALGDISQAFDFSQSPRPPLLLNPHPTPGPPSTP